MEKDILYEGQAFGRIHIERDGIYYSVSARCPFRAGIYRLYLRTGNGAARLGVLFPEKDELTLSRHIPAHELEPGVENGQFVLMPGAIVPEKLEESPAAAEPDSAVFREDMPCDDAACIEEPSADEEVFSAENEISPETSFRESSGNMIDRWSECADASEFTSDEVLKPRLFLLSGVLYRYRAGGVELAIPAQSAEAVSAVLALTRAEEIRGRDYFIISLDRDGFPSPAMHPSSL